MEDETKKAAKLFASMGGKALRDKYGPDHFSKLGKKGSKKRWNKKKKGIFNILSAS